MGERPTIAFRVDESQKVKWEGYADEHDEYDSLSHLIRVAVAHEMSDRYGPLNQAGGEGDGGSSEQIGELVTTVEKMQHRLSDVEDALKDATEAAYTTSDTPQDTPTEGELLAALPHGEENAKTGQTIAKEVGVTNSETALMTEYKLERMANESGAVHSVLEGSGYDSWAEAMAGEGEDVTKLYYRED